MKLKAPDAVAARARSPINWFSAIFLAAFLTIISASAAVPPPSAEELNGAGKWVVERVTAGKEADLSKQFHEEEDRKLSAHFLEDLLTDTLPNVKLHRHGVRISGAIIDEPIDLENAQIPCEVWLEHCQFNKSVTFRGASFVGQISFQNSTFKADADFNGMKVRGAALFNDAVFEGAVDFAGSDIAGNFDADGAQFQNEEKEATFNSMKVRGVAFFRKAVFKGAVDFTGSDIAVQFVANEA